MRSLSLRRREAGAAIVEHAQQVAVGDAARGGVGGMHGDRLAALDLGGARMRAVVELAVQLVGRLVRQHVQRIALGRLGAQPFGGLQPGRMARAVVVAERGDLLGEDLDPARRRLERMSCGIGAEGRQHHRLAALALGLGDAGLPELVERRDRRRRPRPTSRATARRDASATPWCRGPRYRPRRGRAGARARRRSSSRRAPRRPARAPSSWRSGRARGCRSRCRRAPGWWWRAARCRPCARPASRTARGTRWSRACARPASGG